MLSKRSVFSVLFILLTIRVSSALDLSPLRAEGSARGISFDAIIEEVSVVSGVHAVLFARYWITPDLISTEIVWYEPHWTAITYPYYPVSTWITSATDEFIIANSVRLRKWSAKKPLPRRNSFPYQYGQYDLEELALTEEEDKRARIYVEDIESAGPSITDGTFEIPANPDKNSYGPITVTVKEGLLSEVILNDLKNSPKKKVRYVYDNNDGRPFLSEIGATLYEEDMLGRSKNFNLVGADKSKVVTLNVPLKYHSGGRETVVEFERKELGGVSMRLPVHVEVHNPVASSPVRSVRFINYRLLDDSDTDVFRRDDASEYSKFDQDELNWRKLEVDYWRKNPDDISDKDKATLEDLRKKFSTDGGSDETLGEALRRIHMLCMTELILGDYPGCIAVFESYLNMLADNDLKDAVLNGGGTFVRMAILWDNAEIIDEGVRVWSRKCISLYDVRSLLDFAFRMNLGKKYWVSYKMLTALDPYVTDPSERFETDFLICMSLRGLLFEQIVENSGNRPPNTGYFPQDLYGARDMLETAFTESLRKAMVDYSAVENPDSRFQGMKQKLDEDLQSR